MIHVLTMVMNGRGVLDNRVLVDRVLVDARRVVVSLLSGKIPANGA